MKSKLSRFLTIATLTTVTCIITHPSNAKIVEIENSHSTTNNSIKVEKLIGSDYIKTNVSSNIEVDHDGLLLYAIVADYYNKGQQKINVVADFHN